METELNIRQRLIEAIEAKTGTLDNLHKLTTVDLIKLELTLNG